MIKTKTVAVIAVPIVVTGVFAVTLTGMTNYKFDYIFKTKGDGESGYVLNINSTNRLSGGNVQTKGGTNIHFDEYGVNEDVTGGVVELAAYGSLALQTYISGIEKVEVTSETGEGKAYFLTVGATPNSSEYVTEGFDQGYSYIDLTDTYGSGCYYFSVQNKTDVPIIIKSIAIHYSCVDGEAHLKQYIQDHLCAPLDVEYNGSPFNPYYGYPLDPSEIPSNRVVIQTMKDGEYPTAPGRYTYGYDVYDVDKDGNARKLLYTKTRFFKIHGERMEPVPDGRNCVTFHIPDENGNEKIICQTTYDNNYDLSNLPEECLQYSWESPYNQFNYIGDEHYYPVFRVTGLSPNKEGDGCYPVHLTYSYAEKGFSMPNPQMKPGYQFGGWYTDVECTKPFDENKMYYGNLVLYAKCIETDLNVRRVYYHYEDGTLSNRIDVLYSNDEELTLPEAETFMDIPTPDETFFWEIFCGSTCLGIYMQTRTNPAVTGNKIKYSDFSGHDGDIHVYATTVKKIPNNQWTYDLFSEDGEHNNVFQHTEMASTYKRETDFVIPGFAARQRENGEYHLQADGFTVDRTGQFFMTDEKSDAYVVDGGTLKTIASYGYGNIEIQKPLSGILRHESVKKVSRRAFFNRYGLKGTYFPKNATEFEVEAYANVTFNRILTLPKGLTRIGDRCFLGAENIKYVCLPRTIKSIGRQAFCYATYNHSERVFENVTDRTVPGNEEIIFLYEGSEHDFNILDDQTKEAITSNAAKIVYNYSYNTYYGRG